MRLAQASKYARKALALLPSDESLWKTLAKDIYTIVQGSAKVAGSVSTLDPSKLLEGLETWAQLPQLVQSIIDVVDRLSSLRAGFKSVFNNGKGVKKPPRWYFALRYTDMMLQNNCPKLLKSLLRIRNSDSSPLGWGSRQFRTTIDIIEVPADEGRGGLVNKAWMSCSQAHIFYADHAIQLRYEHKALGLLKIKRFNGDSLLMDKCYINLSIVQSSDAQKAESTDFPISISRRWGISGAPEAEQMSLSNIFIKTKKSSSAVMQRQGSLDRRRILIRGQAGVGKSTLCKKMVYDFIHEGMWNDVIDRNIWIPLRELESNGNVQPQVQQLLGVKYFSGARDGHILAKAFFETSHADPNKTFFILDGLDEVYSEVDGRNELLLKLLNRPLAIITSRPSGIKRTHIKDIDLE
ncbi:pfs domain containing protein [Grosmannia clavigera kw1407]|uniref:Pfs domain containing protein n=1 Tax=Grosmannia clavigera (strain kw1407 / UAMH 11150) TaxID=655863 RepID=F0X8T8_GROCL|nr:pfs domain containing protein [Grosmannia clavigera kw1407]EFX06068.1 pfs domain containing protein [Grosmannia clavigera kw1407]